MNQVSNQQLKTDLAALTTYPEWPAFQVLLDRYITELESVRNLNANLPVSLEVQALARKVAGETIRDILNTILTVKQQQQPSEKPKLDPSE